MSFGGLEYVDGKYVRADLLAAPLVMPSGGAAAATLPPGGRRGIIGSRGET